MTTRRLILLCAVILGTFSLVYVLPQQLGYQPVGVVLDLPEYLGAWKGDLAAVTEQERTVLGEDTSFARRNYNDGVGDGIYASIVLSGQDMMTGIHRPERCLQAQGWSTGNSSRQPIEVPEFGRLEATRLQTSRVDTRPLPEGSVANPRMVRSVSYYWFVGYTDFAATHEQRVMLDFRDRIVHGYNQRWAMVMLTSVITEGVQRFGRNEQQTDDLVQDFIKKLAPKITGPSVRRYAAAQALGTDLLASEAGRQR